MAPIQKLTEKDEITQTDDNVAETLNNVFKNPFPA